jgi:hypothetical protein
LVQLDDSPHRLELVLLLGPPHRLHQPDQITRRGYPWPEAASEVDPLGAAA